MPGAVLSWRGCRSRNSQTPFEVVKVAHPQNDVVTLATATANVLTLSPKDAKDTCHVDGGIRFFQAGGIIWRCGLLRWGCS
jgi:hypothetical protein